MALLLGIANLLLYTLVGLSLFISYGQYQERAEIASRNLSTLVALSVGADIAQVDLGLMVASDEAARLRAIPPPETDRLEHFLTQLQARLPMTDSIRIADASGTVIAGSNGLSFVTSIADRAFFTRLRDTAGPHLEISGPMLGRISGKWVVIFARRLDTPTGEFAGVVYAPVTIEWFERKFEGVDIGPEGAVVMRGNASRDFELLARHPRAGFVGQTTVSSTFRDIVAATPQSGTYQAHTGADGVWRTISYKAVSPYPLITLVGLSPRDYLDEWWREVAKVAALATLFTLVTSLGGVRMLRSWRTLEQRSAALARSNADLEQFAYVASHDLQTPLRNIASYAQLLKRRYIGRLDTDADAFIDFIVDGAKHMSRMITDLLDYARISTSTSAPVPVDLAAIVAEIQNMMSDMIEEAGARITVGPLPRIMAEPQQMEILFHNLIENALTYADPTRPAEIDIRAEPLNGLWHVSVRDNGIGIEAEYLEKVFVIFQRLSPHDHPDGTGIGLALCRRIVHRFGGTIWLDSHPGQGTAVHFTLHRVHSGR